MSAFDGQRICIVGGTAGMGRAIAARAAEAGAEVILTGRSAARAASVAAEIGRGASGQALEILDASAIEAFFAGLGEIDHLVTTAAVVRNAPFRTGDPADARATFEGKYWSQYLCAKAARVRRSILMFSGTASRRPHPGMSNVSAVNAAVEALGRSLALELGPVRVNVLSPGFVQGTEAFAGVPEAVMGKMIADIGARLPVQHVGGPDAIAAVAMGVLESGYMTGAVVDVDGGGLVAR